MQWHFELVKIVVPALLGFLFGRLQTSYTDRVARSKDIQNELLKSIRSCTTLAIDYHSKTRPQDSWPVAAAHLKHQLLRIRTDVFIINDLCKHGDIKLKSSLLEFFDAVTAYPFEASELSAEVDSDRFRRISMSSEKLVEELNKCRPKLF
jgi:hypothetical protein